MVAKTSKSSLEKFTLTIVKMQQTPDKEDTAHKDAYWGILKYKRGKNV